MPMDGFTLSFMAHELKERLVGGRLDKVNQPSRDQMIFTIRNNGANYKLMLSASANNARAQITAHTPENPLEPPSICMLFRKHLTGGRIMDVRQYGCDRIMIIQLSCTNEMGDEVQESLVLEMIGKHNNISLVDENQITIESIYHVNADVSNIRVLMPGKAFHMPPQQDKLNPFVMAASELEERLAQHTVSLFKAFIESISGLSAISAKELCAQLNIPETTPCNEVDIRDTAERVCAFYAQLYEIGKPVVLCDDTGGVIDFFPFQYKTYAAENQKQYASLSEAMDAFYAEREMLLHNKQRSAGIRKRVKSNVTRLEKKKAKMLEALQMNERADQNRIFGELLTANLHLVEKGANSVNVINYYDENQPTIKIPLQSDVSPSKNAQLYFKKYHKAKGAREYARKELSTIETELEILENVTDDLDKSVSLADLNEIRYFLMENGFLRKNSTSGKRRKRQEGKPYQFFTEDGTEIIVGKNSVQNDRITLHARANETWLHAQGVPGSHVIIRTEETPSDDTLLFAAKLACYFSKGRNHPSFPIDYTKRKYVKKKSGTPAGFVIYQNFKTILIGLTPDDFKVIKQSILQGSGGGK